MLVFQDIMCSLGEGKETNGTAHKQSPGVPATVGKEKEERLMGETSVKGK